MSKFLQAQERDLSLGIKRKSGKGERCIVVGIGGPDGFVDYEVIKRSRRTGNKMEYKDDMGRYLLDCLITTHQQITFHSVSDGDKFNALLHRFCEKLPEKSVIIMDNASYHTKLVSP